jgi:hypothetical protein
MYVSFFICAIHFYEAPVAINYFQLLTVIVGFLMVIGHIVISFQNYQSNGPSGWFYGEFFIETFKLHHKLNNESFISLSLWGVSLICQSQVLLVIAAAGQICQLCFVKLIQFQNDKDKWERLENNDDEKIDRNVVDQNDTDTNPETLARSASYAGSFESSSTPRTPRSRSVSVDYFGVTETVMQAVHGLESIAIPHFKSLVEVTKRSVTHLANAARLDNTLPREELPLHLYSLKLIKSSESDHEQEPIYQFGEVFLLFLMIVYRN